MLIALLNAHKGRVEHLVWVSIGDRIREARLRAGFTQRSLAARLGVDKSAVAQWEGGGGGSGIKTSNLVEVARILGVKPSELLGEPSPSDHLVLHDTDEISIIMMLRAMPRRLRVIYRRLAETTLAEGQFRETGGNDVDRSVRRS